MAVLLRFSVPGLTPEVFDRIAGGMREAELLRQQPGFLMQAVYATADGLGAVEICDTVEQWREWDDKPVLASTSPIRPDMPEMTALGEHSGAPLAALGAR